MVTCRADYLELCCIPPTLVTSEQLFSESSLLYATMLRNRLFATKADEILSDKAFIALPKRNDSGDDQSDNDKPKPDRELRLQKDYLWSNFAPKATTVVH